MVVSFSVVELYGLSSQIKRSAVSIPSNIEDGAARQRDKEWIHFLYIALGSAAEIETQLLIADTIGLMDKRNIETHLE